MNDRFIALTSGWIPVCVLLLLAAALISGRPGAVGEQRAGTVVAGSFPDFSLKPGESDASLVSGLLPLPDDVRIAVDSPLDGRVRTAEAGPQFLGLER